MLSKEEFNVTEELRESRFLHLGSRLYNRDIIPLFSELHELSFRCEFLLHELFESFHRIPRLIRYIREICVKDCVLSEIARRIILDDGVLFAFYKVEKNTPESYA